MLYFWSYSDGGGGGGGNYIGWGSGDYDFCLFCQNRQKFLTMTMAEI